MLHFRSIAVLACALISVSLYAGGNDPVINEFVADHTGTDANEFIEIFGDPSTDYSTFTVVEIEGDGTSSGLIDDATTTVGTTDANGFWDTGFLNNQIENGTVTLLLVEGYTGSVGDDIDTDNDGTIDVTPWTRIVDSVAFPDGGGTDQVYSTVSLLPNFDGNPNQVGGASRIPNGIDTDAVGDWTRNDFNGAGIPALNPGTPELGEALNTPGANNELVTLTAADPLINEFVFNHTGTDNNEFIEVSGDPSTDYSAYTLVGIEGDGGSAGIIDDVIAVGSTDANGYWDTGFVANQVENGTVSLLLVEGFSGSQGDDLDTNNDGTLDTTPWTRIVDDIGVTDGGGSDINYSTVVLDGNFDSVGFTVGGASRIPDSTDTDTTGDWARNDFDGAGIPALDPGTPDAGEAINTPGAVNQPVVVAPQNPVLINETDADTPGSDVAEFVELYDGGAGNTSLDGLVLVFYNGSGDTSYRAIDLDGQSTDANGFFVAGNAAVTGVDVVFPNNGLQNGADAVGLYQADGTDFPNGTAVTTTNLQDAVVYDTNDSDDAGLLVLLNAAEPQLNEGGAGNKDLHSNQRCPDGGGGARNTSGFVQAPATPDAVNDCPPQLVLVINEVDADTAGTDTLEFIELYDGGVGNTSLDGLALVTFNGSDDASYNLGGQANAIDLDGFSTNANGYFVVGNAGVAQASITFTNNTLQNGADAVALYRADGTDFPNDTPVTTTNLIDAFVYDTNDGDDAGLLALMNAGQAQINEDGGVDKDTESNQRCPNGTGGERNSSTYTQFVPTPGSENCVVPLPPLTCNSGNLTLISAIQGNSISSPLLTQVVDIEGVVVGDFQGDTTMGDLGGFFVQEEDGDADGDPATSEGIFVFDDTLGVAVNLGDLVRVRGTVTEFGAINPGDPSLTELTLVSDVVVCGNGQSVTSTAVNLPMPSADDYERYEGMAVSLPQTLTVSDAANSVRFGEVVVSLGRLFTPTEFMAPGAPANAQQAANDLNQIIIDDTRNGSYRMPFINGGDDATPENALNPIRGGYTVTAATGVLSQSFGSYRLRPTTPVVWNEAANPRTAAPSFVGGNLQVAVMNVLNYFSTPDDSGSICGPSGSSGCRGADTASELTRQLDKLIAALVAINADVLGLVEIENNASASIQDVVDGLNAALGAGTYDFIDSGSQGTDAIRNGIIYKPGSVTPFGNFAILNTAAEATFNDFLNRPSVAQTFFDNTGGVFTFVVNHFKSKACGGAAGLDLDQGDGQACYNPARVAAANALATWLATDPTGSGDPDFLIVGDLNANTMEDPMNALSGAGFNNLVPLFGGGYTLSFQGQVGSLDHALASGSLLGQVTGATSWRINADENALFSYNEEALPGSGPAKPADFYNADPYRSSDHDPIVIGLQLIPNVGGDALVPIPTLQLPMLLVLVLLLGWFGISRALSVPPKKRK